MERAAAVASPSALPAAALEGGDGGAAEDADDGADGRRGDGACEAAEVVAGDHAEGGGGEAPRHEVPRDVHLELIDGRHGLRVGADDRGGGVGGGIGGRGQGVGRGGHGASPV